MSIGCSVVQEYMKPGQKSQPMVCNASMQGNGANGKTRGQDCSKPIPLEGSNMVFTSTEETFGDGTKATFECATGYVSAGGSRSVTCTAGVWSTVKRTCELRPCGSPGEVLNGRYNLSGVLFGARAVAFCDTGYTLVGSGVRNCLVGGWDGRVPVCEVVKCGKPPTIVNGGPVIPPEDEYSYRSVVEYSCEKEFTLVGTKSIVCEKDGEFQPAPPECKMVSCPDPVVENGVRIQGRSPPYKHKSYVMYKCNDGFKMTGEASLTCEIEGWSASIPTCKALPTTTGENVLPKNILNGYYSDLQSFGWPIIVNYMTVTALLTPQLTSLA
ncbi:membrane cofactor protein-like isoform 3-T4 [Salvelinus alpinus]